MGSPQLSNLLDKYAIFYVPEDSVGVVEEIMNKNPSMLDILGGVRQNGQRYNIKQGINNLCLLVFGEDPVLRTDKSEKIVKYLLKQLDMYSVNPDKYN